MLAFPKYDGLLPASILTTLEAKAPNFWKWANAVVKENSVTYIWDEKVAAEKTLQKLKELAAAK